MAITRFKLFSNHCEIRKIIKIYWLDDLVWLYINYIAKNKNFALKVQTSAYKL